MLAVPVEIFGHNRCAQRPGVLQVQPVTSPLVENYLGKIAIAFPLRVVFTTMIPKFLSSPPGCWQCPWGISSIIGVPNIVVFSKPNQLHHH